MSGENSAATMIFPAAQLRMEASLLSTRAWLAQGLEVDILEVGSAAKLHSLSLYCCLGVQAIRKQRL